VAGPAGGVGGRHACSFALCGTRATLFLQDALDPSLQGTDLVVTGTVASMPQRNELGQRFRFAVDRRSQAAANRCACRRGCRWPGMPGAWAQPWDVSDAQRAGPDLRAGDRWRFTVRLRAPHGNLNPHGFDYELWLWEQGLQATGAVRAGPADDAPRRLAPGWGHPVEGARQQVRDAILSRVADQRSAGVLAALVVGDQNAIDRSDWDVFRATGVAHLMSISGLHVTMFAWLAGVLVGKAWRRSGRLCLALPAPQAALVGGTGPGHRVCAVQRLGRAGPAHLADAGLGRVVAARPGRRWPWPVTWLAACAVVLTADPWALLQAGFWLSFVAVGVLFATDRGLGAAPAGVGRAGPAACCASRRSSRWRWRR
jgi:competence protein ComEC